ncbi:MAG: hypothetical protein ACLRZH_19110 [Ruthenibacterium lactatiformans]
MRHLKRPDIPLSAENALERAAVRRGKFSARLADYWFDMANEKAGWNGKCVLVQPIAQG